MNVCIQAGSSFRRIGDSYAEWIVERVCYGGRVRSRLDGQSDAWSEGGIVLVRKTPASVGTLAGVLSRAGMGDPRGQV